MVGQADSGTKSTSTSIVIRKPDDFHVHFRDNDVLHIVAPLTARQFNRAIVMPNLKPPVRNLQDAVAYHSRIMAALPKGTNFTPLMTLYLTDHTTGAEIREAHASSLVKACKLYPAGATTNSAFGVTAMDKITDALAAMEQVGMVLCVHGEATGTDVDIFDKERVFIDSVLPKLLEDYPRLKIVLEHVTTAEAAEIVQATPGNRLAATITAHHLLYCRQAIFQGAKIHPHMFCLPVLKRESHRQALLRAVRDDENGKFFAGTDSAPHVRSAKICADGCAGIFTGMCAVELYTEAFEEAGVLEKLESFLSENGARFYGLALNEGKIRLEKKKWTMPETIEVAGSDPIVPLRAGEQVCWSMQDEE